MHHSYQELDDSKRDLDDLIIKVSNQLRSRDSDWRDLNYQTHSDKEHLVRKCDLISRELQSEKETRGRLELLEGDLLHRLQAKERECMQMKQTVKEQEEKLALNKEAIEKAHKIIQALNAEMDRGAEVLKGVEDERNRLKKENKEIEKRVGEMGKQVQSQIAKEQQK